MNAWRFLLKFDRGVMESEKEVEVEGEGGGEGEGENQGGRHKYKDRHALMCGDLGVQRCYVIQCGRCARSYVI